MQTIDCTPTWSGLVRHMLYTYLTLSNLKRPTKEQSEALKGLEKEFRSMAYNADLAKKLQKS